MAVHEAAFALAQDVLGANYQEGVSDAEFSHGHGQRSCPQQAIALASLG